MIDPRDAEIQALRAEVSNLKAQQAAAVCAWEEYSRWPDLPSPVVGRVRFPDGHEEDLALRPEQITGILSGIEKHVRECLPFGVAAVRSHQDIDGLRHKLAALRARVTELRAVERAAREYRRRERIGGGCDIETTERLACAVEDARRVLDAALDGVETKT